MTLNFNFSRPFIIDLESTNGTYVNGEAVPTSRYYELQLNDGASDLFPLMTSTNDSLNESHQIWTVPKGICPVTRRRFIMTG
jgi:pSer/pThr/pTyr-binding forkhead associated (FHA) protein